MLDNDAAHESNPEQRDAWDGDTGAYWAANSDPLQRPSASTSPT